MSSQLQLMGFKRFTPYANRGREFQTILNNTHLWYERQGWGKIYEIPNAFSFVSERQWQASSFELRARTAKGAPLLRIRSAPDYLGAIEGRHIEFDAKEFSGASISIENFKEHQVENLYRAERAGSISGFMILEKRTLKVYWVEAGYVREWIDHLAWKKGGIKSLNFSKVTDARVRLLCEVERNSIAHYAPGLIAEFSKKAASFEKI